MIFLIKVLIAAIALKVVIETLLRILAGHLQVKYFLVTFGYLVLNIIKVWIWVKETKKAHHHPEHIVYEHDHHHSIPYHHEIPEHEYPSAPHDAETHGEAEHHESSGSYWRRAYQEAMPELLNRAQQLAYRGQRPQATVAKPQQAGYINFLQAENYGRNTN